eukprot:g13556.t1
MVATMKTANRWLGLLGAVTVMCSASVLATSTSTQECITDFFADGDCDQTNNRAECGYDSGDCCSCTCVDGEFDCGGNGFQCIDPAAPCVNDDDITVDVVENCPYLNGKGNGYCDTENNNALCDYDGGDCCQCTCDPGDDEDDDYKCREGFQCIDPAAPCVADDDITVEKVENCGYVEGIGNGFCDTENNNALCDYDGGDCCECTCSTEGNPYDDDIGCRDGFQCIDPAAPCVDDDDVTIEDVENCGYVEGKGNGFCDTENNNALCDYDGGDCCQCTCSTEGNPYDDDYGCRGGFQCIDPAAPCVDDDDVTAEQLENCGYISGKGNGYCDTENNNALCDYDGGDCCQCTCTTENIPYDDDYGCRDNFQCIDPAAPCVDDDDITVDLVETCDFVGGIGDGYCNEENNNAECNYDGGDCCECTCVAPPRNDDYYVYADDPYVGCGAGFACIDPNAPCVNDDDITVDLIDICDTVRMANAFCDQDLNTPECNYDGGDCCSCTCEDKPNQECGGRDGFACIDPDAQCVDDDDITVNMLEECGWVGGIGNGYCDEENNKEACNYDGGDCCQCTCDPTNADDDQGCGRWSNFACIDPLAPCVDDDSVTVDMIDICDAGSIGNGYCDDYNNTPECAYDGGDCCSCTCDPAGPGAGDDDACQYGFACIDPSAPCVNDDDITIDMLDACNWVVGIGNGYCDLEMNTPECNYDGGDCCECTCEVENGDDESGGRFSGCNEFACVDPEASCVDDDLITVDMIENCGYVLGIGNGYCDRENNNELCAYDGGDCCSCTCTYEWDDDYACSQEGSGFDCRDPGVSCFGEELTLDDDFSPFSYNFGDDDFFPFPDDFGDDDFGDDMEYDFMPDFIPDYTPEFIPREQERPFPTVDDAVEVGTKTEVGVTATAHDMRPGASSAMVGCGEAGGDGCAPALTRDGISSEVESRWSCSPKLVDGEEPCQIEYTFAEPQDIIDIQVAFWKSNDRIRTLEVHFDGVRVHTHESYADFTYNKLGVSGSGVTTVTLESIELLPDEWISLIEVLIFVAP